MNTTLIRWKQSAMIAFLSLMGLLAFTPNLTSQYCESDGGDGYPNIESITFGDIYNYSGDNDGYGDFTDLSTNLELDSYNDIVLNAGGPWWIRFRWTAWIDYDQNGTFDDDELVVHQSGYGNEYASVYVPDDALGGATRLRISMDTYHFQGPCAHFDYGEVEDYTVNINGGCETFAGTLTAVESMVCSNGMNTISATPNGDIEIPEGYSSVFVLTQGEGLVIVNAGAEPSFEVSEPGLYTIHTLVYDTETLDLGIIQLGITTGFDVFGLIAPGGGSICADLDVAGAPIMVQNPDAGTLSGGGEACAVGGAATLTATPNGDANVPSGYSTVYVLTQGDGLTIINAGAEPSFDVTEAGNYTIHTLVYNPETLDLGIVELGVTTGFDVNGLLVQGGGAICASLDVPGAPFSVVECACVADAGSLVADASTVCSSGVTTISASINQMPFIPEGYAQVYVLTQGDGLVIVNAGAEPSFEVEGGGLYTVHSLVFDPTTLDLGIVELGVTTGFDLNGLLIQGGGEICASLDVAGAPIVIENPSAGTLYPENFLNCLSDEPTVLTAVADGNAIVPEGYELLYVLTNAYNLTILDVNSEPTFEVTQFGFYRIHTLVYNSETLNLGVVELGVTTGFDVNDLLTQGGGEVCGSLDVYGALLIAVDQWICDFLWQFFRGEVPTDPRVIEQIIAEYDLQNGPADLVEMNVYPNPTVGDVTLQVDAASTTNAQLEIYDVTGRVVKSMQTLQFAEGLNNSELDLSPLETGNYVIRLITSNRALTTSFIKE